jgi:hypothetical protein
MDATPIKSFYCVADRLLFGRLFAGLTAIEACKHGVDKMRCFVEQKKYTVRLMD